jgi:hypothetical protein
MWTIILAGCVMYSLNLENGGSKDVQKFGNTAYICRMPSPRNMIYISNEIQFLGTVLRKMYLYENWSTGSQAELKINTHKA